MTSVGKHFSRAAQTYERGASVHRQVASRLIEILPGSGVYKLGSILEVGCGTGILTELLFLRYAASRLYLLDSAEGMIATVRERWGLEPRMGFIVSDIRDYVGSQTYDLIVSSSALHWAIPLKRTFCNLKRHLSTNGQCCVALMIDGTMRELHELRRRLVPGKIPEGRLPTGNEVLAAAKSAGFSIQFSAKDCIQSHYHSADDFLSTIHAQGLTGGAVSRSAISLSRSELKQLRQAYDVEFQNTESGVFASFVVQYLKLK